jgi:hypothetical protein
MRTRVLRHGVIAGAIGFATVALIFVLSDTVLGRAALYTPALLGGALFESATAVEGVAVTNVFLVVLVHVSGIVLVLSASVRDVVSTWLVGIATAVAGLVMAAYLIRVEPPLRRELREREYAEP